MSKEEFTKLSNLAKDIKGSHFNLGDGMNDYKTTTGSNFNFDYQKAKESKGVLRDELINDLRATHYKLGYDKVNKNYTTHQSSYVPLGDGDRMGRTKVSEELRKSHFSLNNSNNAVIGKSIYTTDYTKKEVVVD